MAQHGGRRDQPGGSAAVRVGAVAGLVVVAVVAARARAQGFTPHVSGRVGHLVMGVVDTVGLALVVAGLVLLVWGRRIRAPTPRAESAQPRPALAGAQRRRLVVAGTVGAMGALVALGYQVLGQLLPSSPDQQAPGQGRPVTRSDPSGVSDPGQLPQLHQAGPGAYVTAAVTAIALGALLYALARRKPAEEPDKQDEEPRPPAGAVAEAVAAGRAAVRDSATTDPRQAIVACFAAMERALSGMGEDVAPRAADTPGEVLRRGVDGASLPAAPALVLLRLFREARFSDHPLGQDDRAAAGRALSEILTSLDPLARRAR